MNLSENSQKLIKDLIDKGWQVFLNYAPFEEKENNDSVWEVDFTKKLESGLYDNHVSGISKDINEAVKIAYDNIINENRL